MKQIKVFDENDNLMATLPDNVDMMLMLHEQFECTQNDNRFKIERVR